MSSAISSPETTANGAESVGGAEATSPTALGELKALVTGPRSFFAKRLADPPAPRSLFLTRVTPLAALRPAGALLSSLFVGSPLAGVVVGLGSYALQIGTWLGLALVLPALARQFHADLNERQSFALITYASLPLWLAGLLFVIPEESGILYTWSRLLALLVTLFSLYLVRQGIVALGVRRSMRMPLLGGITVAGLLIHGLLFLLFGISSHIALFIFG